MCNYFCQKSSEFMAN